MKLRILLSFLLAFVVVYVSAQNVLLIKNSKTGKTSKIKNNNTITLLSSADSVFVTGKIKQIKDHSIVLYFPDDEDLLREYDIASIKQIKKRTCLHNVARIAGMGLMPVGGFIFISGVFFALNNNGTHWGYWLGGGAALFGLGIIPHTLIKTKTYDMNKGYQLQVVKE